MTPTPSPDKIEELVKKLKFGPIWYFNRETHEDVIERCRPIMQGAAHAILTLSARVRELEEALKPFAKMADEVDVWRKGTGAFEGVFDHKDLYRARALSPKTTDGGEQS